VRYVTFSLAISAIFLGSVISLMYEYDKICRENIIVRIGFVGLVISAIFVFFYTNRELFRAYANNPNKNLLFRIVLGTQKSRSNIGVANFNLGIGVRCAVFVSPHLLVR
jgi:hypothetical protein